MHFVGVAGTRYLAEKPPMGVSPLPCCHPALSIQLLHGRDVQVMPPPPLLLLLLRKSRGWLQCAGASCFQVPC